MKLPDHWFYGSPAAQAGTFSFDPEETSHALKVLRMHVGAELQWLDGTGGRYSGTITGVTKGGMTAFAKTHHQDAAPHELHLAVGVLHDPARLEWLVEKATELGVTRISLLQSQRVQRSRYRMSRLAAKALAALKQSGRSFLPVISELEWPKLLATKQGTAPGPHLHLIAHCYDELPRQALWQIWAVSHTSVVEKSIGAKSVGGELTAEDSAAAKVVAVDSASPAISPSATSEQNRPTTSSAEMPACTMLIGPEGDFTLDEVAAAEAAGFTAISLGQARLRTETAAIAALSIIQLGR